jgi:hypothetical protein
MYLLAAAMHSGVARDPGTRLPGRLSAFSDENALGRDQQPLGLTAIVRHHPAHLHPRIEFHVLTGCRAGLVFVAENHARKPPHHLLKFKRQVGVCLQPSPKILAQRNRTSYSSGGIVQEPDCHRRCQLYLRRIVRENGVQIMRIPCAHPIISKFFDLSFAEHGVFFSPPELFQRRARAVVSSPGHRPNWPVATCS